MATVAQKSFVVRDALMVVAQVLEDRPKIPVATLREIAGQVSGIEDRAAFRAQVVELADEAEGNAQTAPDVS